jgi:CheY-like chemotaxis protein
MPTQSALSLVDAIAEEANPVAPSGFDGGLRVQVALVRALVNALEHHDPAEARVAALHAQLGEELNRLADLVSEERERRLPEIDPLDLLVVERDGEARHVAELVAEKLGYQCRGATTGEDALLQYEDRPAAIVFVDSDTSETAAGFVDLGRTLKKRDPNAYVIAVTDSPAAERGTEARRSGVDDLLPKPIDTGELAERLQAAKQLVRAVHTLQQVKSRFDSRRGSATGAER